MNELTIALKVVLFNIIIFYTILKNVANKPGDFGDEPLSNHDILYFLLTTLSTVGYGDISPKSKRAKNVVMVFQFTMIIELYAFIINKIKN